MIGGRIAPQVRNKLKDKFLLFVGILEQVGIQTIFMIAAFAMVLVAIVSVSVTKLKQDTTHME